MPRESKQSANTGSRYTRAVNLERDLTEQGSLNGYILTAGSRRVLRRIISAFHDGTAPRSWTLTGPYGTGKSAVALYAAQLFTPSNKLCSVDALELLKSSDSELAADFLASGKTARLWPVAVTGSREPLNLAILRGLKKSLAAFYSRRRAPDVLHLVSRQLHQATTGNPPTARNLTDLFSLSLESVSKGHGAPDGIFLIVDELGKLLEYAAAHPANSDLYLLQSLAEFAARAQRPFLILGILHQDFSRYTDRLSSRERAEWDKIRGRFEDIAFEEPADEILRLIAQERTLSYQPEESSPPHVVRASDSQSKMFRDLCEKACELGLAFPGMTKAEFLTLLRRCWPLHPLVSVMLGQVFRKLAQNERSVFSFLESSEPYGLRESLRDTTSDDKSLYHIDRLYDYLVNSLGEGLYLHSQGKRWAEIETILTRLPDAGPTEIFLVKATGLLGTIGQWRNLRATREILHFAAHGVASAQEVDHALAALKAKSVVTWRRYNDSIALWEGSDVDLDERTRAARGRLDPAVTTATLASKCLAPRPIIARRHSFKTGSLRYFKILFVSPDEIAPVLERTADDSDGAVLIVLPDNADQAAMAESIAVSPKLKDREDILLALPSDTGVLGNVLRDVACLEWVKNNTPELDGDQTARRELRAAMVALQRQMDASLGAVLFHSDAGASSCRWFHKGRERRLVSRRAIHEYLSKICDALYSQTACIRNELINRRELSSAAAAARRNLIEAMILRGNEPDLGIKGTPPERSIYLSLLARPGIHRRTSRGWEFGAPMANSGANLKPTWAAILNYFKASEQVARPVSALFKALASPPYGLKAGPVPVILCAALLSTDAEVALYEDGSFIPHLTVAALERLMKSPERFAVQRWHLTGVQTIVFQRLAEMLGRDFVAGANIKSRILGIVRPLCRFAAQLNEYARNTGRLSVTAQQIRTVLLQARQPDRLLFVDLPRACGLEAFDTRLGSRNEHLEAFIGQLRQGLGELQRCYDALLGELTQALAQAFRLSPQLGMLRQALARRAEVIKPWAADPVLKSFVSRITDSQLNETAWLESLASLLSQKLPAVWRDDDQARFEVGLTKTARLFEHLESLAFDGSAGEGSTLDGNEDALRIGITTKDAPEIERVIRLPVSCRERIERLEQVMKRALQDAGAEGQIDLELAALARLTRQLLS